MLLTIQQCIVQPSTRRCPACPVSSAEAERSCLRGGEPSEKVGPYCEISLWTSPQLPAPRLLTQRFPLPTMDPLGLAIRQVGTGLGDSSEKTKTNTLAHLKCFLLSVVSGWSGLEDLLILFLTSADVF